MQVSTKAIVLSKLKFKESDLIVKCYTQEYGIVSYILKGVFKSKKGHSKLAYFQLLSQLQLTATHKTNRSLQYINDIKVESLYTTLHTQITKSTVTLFLAEIVSNILKEEEQNADLYSYLEATLQWFDAQAESPNFHLLFLLKLSKHLGFYPDVSTINQPYFNLQSGAFESKQISESISSENLKLLKQLLGTTFDGLNNLKLSSNQRHEFLTLILRYFELHLGSFKTPKSLQIFNQVFN